MQIPDLITRKLMAFQETTYNSMELLHIPLLEVLGSAIFCLVPLSPSDRFCNGGINPLHVRSLQSHHSQTPFLSSVISFFMRITATLTFKNIKTAFSISNGFDMPFMPK
jgi:hypothetical protein